MKKFDFDLKNKKACNVADKILHNILWNSSNISNIHVETEDDSRKLIKVVFDFKRG